VIKIILVYLTPIKKHISMKNSIMIFAFALVAMLTTNTFAQQLNQEELYESSKKIAYQVADDMNLDEDELVYLTRAIYSYEMTMHKVALSETTGSSKQEIEAYTSNAKNQLKSYVTDMFQEGKATKIIAELTKQLDSF
jgi:hypothetical protein